MEPADPLEVKPELKDEKILLSHHSMLTPADYTFSVLRTTTQNFKYRGILWLTENALVYKGFPVVKMGATPVSEKVFKPFCEIDINFPYEVQIPITKISEVFTGHDNTFQKRFQRYPKLRIRHTENGSEVIIYFYLTRENLLDDELYVSKRCSEWQTKITEILGAPAIAQSIPATPTVGKVPTTSPLPARPSSLTVPPIPAAPKPPGLVKTDQIFEKAAEEIGAKRFGKVTVKPLEERERPQFAAMATPIKDEAEESEPEFTKLLDALVPVSDEEFAAAAADTSIAKCPHCGWILGYATTKCPRCRKAL